LPAGDSQAGSQRPLSDVFPLKKALPVPHLPH
jgi:hypothetical protein